MIVTALGLSTILQSVVLPAKLWTCGVDLPRRGYPGLGMARLPPNPEGSWATTGSRTLSQETEQRRHGHRLGRMADDGYLTAESSRQIEGASLLVVRVLSLNEPPMMMTSTIFSGAGKLLLACLTVFVLVLIRYAAASRRPRDFPPGPSTLPVIGNLHQLPLKKPFLK